MVVYSATECVDLNRDLFGKLNSGVVCIFKNTLETRVLKFLKLCEFNMLIDCWNWVEL